jgi:hypothetical protein
VKKRYIIIGLLASSLASVAQRQDSSYKKRKLSTTDVQIIMSYYTQDNDHSAVTGGLGTEDLQVYATQIAVDHRGDSSNSFHFDAGLDIISSASTDNIDFVKSSASKIDARTHVNTGYNRTFKKRGISAGVSGSFSIESDYTSFGGALYFSRLNPSQSREVSMSVQMFFDDLRWGRLHDGHPEKLIYPVELRNKEWFDHYRRDSYNLEFGYFRIINKRMSLGIYPGIAYQSGLLSTPFHRVYFSDSLRRVENLPLSRVKFPLGVQLNTFLGGRWIVRTNYRFYWDDFGIVAHTLNLEGACKVSRVFTITPSLRIYAQSEADYFKGYKEHNGADEFYTSDYDLSRFTSLKPGLGIRYAPYSGKDRTTFNAIELRYAFYKRSDGMDAHMITLFINYSQEKKKNGGNNMPRQ